MVTCRVKLATQRSSEPKLDKFTINQNLQFQPPSTPHKSPNMFRTALVRSARSATCQAVRKSSPIVRPASTGLFTKSQFAPSAFQAARCYSASAGLSEVEVTGRIADLLKNFDKVSMLGDFWGFLLTFVAGCRPYQGTIGHLYTYLDNNFNRQLDLTYRALRKWPWVGQPGYRWGCYGYWGGMLIWEAECLKWVLTCLQEFSIEIPDKEADAIHSGMENSMTKVLDGN